MKLTAQIVCLETVQISHPPSFARSLALQSSETLKRVTGFQRQAFSNAKSEISNLLERLVFELKPPEGKIKVAVLMPQP